MLQLESDYIEAMTINIFLSTDWEKTPKSILKKSLISTIRDFWITYLHYVWCGNSRHFCCGQLSKLPRADDVRTQTSNNVRCLLKESPVKKRIFDLEIHALANYSKCVV